MTDSPLFRCGSCHYAGPPFNGISDCQQVECRKDKPTHDGFPIMPVNSWCWDGTPELNVRELLIRTLQEQGVTENDTL